MPIELGMEVETESGYLGIVAGSPRNGKWLVVDGDRCFRMREEQIREHSPYPW